MAFENVAHVQHSLEELQEHNVLDGLKMHVVTGNTADTDISVPGIKTTDKIAFVIGFRESNGTLRVNTDIFSITADDTIQSTVGTRNLQLIVVYYSAVVPD